MDKLSRLTGPLSNELKKDITVAIIMNPDQTAH